MAREDLQARLRGSDWPTVGSARLRRTVGPPLVQHRATVAAAVTARHVYHRVRSPTQTAATARRQESTGEIWGSSPGWGGIACVKAYVGALPAGRDGIEFETDVPPDPSCPPGHARWSGPREGVRVEDGHAKIRVRVTKNTQK
jgi:hypothetical protein